MDDAAIERMERLISAYRRFNQERPDTDAEWLRQFGMWLQGSGTVARTSKHTIPGKEDSIIVMFIIMLTNLTRNHMNKLINKTRLSNIMDYMFLVQLESHGRMGKAEIIALNQMEMSSGIEVIRRLLKNGWVTEEPNPKDRRSKYVVISEKGKTVIDSLSEQMNSFYRSFCSGLDVQEKNEIIYYLERLVMGIGGEAAHLPLDDHINNQSTKK